VRRVFVQPLFSDFINKVCGASKKLPSWIRRGARKGGVVENHINTNLIKKQVLYQRWFVNNFNKTLFSTTPPLRAPYSRKGVFLTIFYVMKLGSYKNGPNIVSVWKHS
jgi:hypothetical protein